MFGFEFQSVNVFAPVPPGYEVESDTGVKERQIVWRHEETGTTLEGDEALTADATACLEFVTPACADRATAIKATQAAVDLADALVGQQKDRKAAIYQAGKKIAGGVWLTNCVVKISDLNFLAQVQAPSVSPWPDITTCWMPSRPAWSLATPTRNMISSPWRSSPTATSTNAVSRRIGRRCWDFLLPVTCFLSDPRSARTAFFYHLDKEGRYPDESHAYFDFKGVKEVEDWYLRKTKLEKLPEQVLVAVGSDSPKNRFQLLHRTDFHSMYQSLDEQDRRLLDGECGEFLWKWGLTHPRLFPIPYRIEPEAVDVGLRSEAKVVALTEQVPADRQLKRRGLARWSMLPCGPTVEDWWESVKHGDRQRGGLAKDSASPPPGFRSRRPEYLTEFTDPQVDKSQYYGMGSFPMHRQGNANLAVFEYREFMGDMDVREHLQNGMVNRRNWVDVVNIFADHYMPNV